MATNESGDPVDKQSRRPALSSVADAASAGTKRMLKSSELLAGTNELRIEHNGEVYLLRQTSKGKLILTK